MKKMKNEERRMKKGIGIFLICALFAALCTLSCENPFFPDRQITNTTYTVTFNGNGGTPATQTKTVTHPATTVGTLPTPPTRTGYDFTGWNTAANGSGNTFTATTVVTASITVYAQWEEEFNLNIEMIQLPPAIVTGPPYTFSMGQTGIATPEHEVTLTKGFKMSKTEVTQGQWYEVMGTTIEEQQALATSSITNYGRGDDYPMYYVNWFEAIVFCNKLSVMENLDPVYHISNNYNTDTWGEIPNSSSHANYATWNTIEMNRDKNGYRLPTEAEWEFACRAGTTGEWSHSSTEHNDYMWYSGNNSGSSGDITYGSKPVGTKLANPWGLHDMHGNVWEWCWDWYGAYSSSAETDPVGASSGSDRILRGGDWFGGASYARSADRISGRPDYRFSGVGFRVLRP